MSRKKLGSFRILQLIFRFSYGWFKKFELKSKLEGNNSRSIDVGLIFSYDSAPLILFIDGDWHDLVQDRPHYIHRSRPDALRRDGTGSCIILSI
jgi:hypothetical protein